MSTKHEFALYYQKISDLKSGSTALVTDPITLHRMISVLRLSVGDELVLFDQAAHTNARVAAIGKKQIEFVLGSLKKNSVLAPTITVLLPVLKREALSEAIYSCVELGANCIQLIKTHKAHRTWGGEKELEHAHKVMIAAAEQSKNFAYPQLHAPIALQDIQPEQAALFFDPAGTHLSAVLADLASKQSSGITIMIGPEGDLVEEEKELLRNKGFIFCALTPTVLRAQQALAVGLGAIRSWTK